MSQNDEDERRQKGLAYRVSRDIVNVEPAKAFKHARTEGYKLRIDRLDGFQRAPAGEPDPLRINVIVVNGLVRKSWVG